MTGNPLIDALQPLLSRVRTDVSCVKKSDGRQAWTREPINEARLAKHLNGGPARGVCPIRAGESVTMCALLDLDSHKGETPWPDMAETALRVMAALEASGLRPISFRSSGGRGIHLFMLWDAPQDAYSVRTHLRELLEGAGFRDGPAGVARGEIEVFPKQDSVAADGFGNQFILPLTGLSEPLEPLLGLAPMGKNYAVGMAWPLSEPVPPATKPERVLPTGEAVGFETLRSAVAAIPNEGEHELDYDRWRNVIFAIHAETGGSGEGLALAHEFSARSSKHDAGFLDDRVWPYINEREGGITGRTVLAMAREHGWVEDVSGDFEVVAQKHADEQPLPPFKRDKNGRIEATIENVTMAVRRPDLCGMDIRHDNFRDEIMFCRRGDDWQTFGDADYTRLRITLERSGFKPIGRELIRDVVHLVATDQPFDSAILWLEGLEWDGVPRVETFLQNYFSAEPTAYVRAVSLYLWTAMAGRVLVPGIKADMVPILVGDQGNAKSSSVAAMVPSPEFFTEVSFNEKDEDLARKMRGRLLAEIGELRGLHTRELESIKAFITRTHENWVPKYKEFATLFPRRLIFIGTTNQEQFLADETGNRRWLPVRTGRADIEAVRRDRLQLWAEARELFGLLGVAYQGAEALATDAHAEHTITDPWAEAIERWLNEPDTLTGDVPGARDFLRVDEVAQGALRMEAKQIGKREEMRICNSLRECGFVRVQRRVKGKKVKVWERVEPPGTTPDLGVVDV